MWQAAGADTLRFLHGRGVQLANLLNFGGLLCPHALGCARGVPTLRPTVVDNFEIGWDRALPGLGAALGVSVGHGRTDDITTLIGGSNLAAGLAVTPVNAADSETSGIELSIEGEAGESWRWGASFTPQSVDDEFVPGLSPENTLPNQVLKARLGWSRGPWEIDGYLRRHSDFGGLASVPSAGAGVIPVSIPGYTALDARLSYAINDRMTIALAGQNLTDSERRQSAAPAVERRVFGTFSVRF